MGLQNLLEDYRNWIKTQEWKNKKQDERLFGGDPALQEEFEKWSGGFSPSNLGSGLSGIAGTFIGKSGAENIGKGEQFAKGAEMLKQKLNPSRIWQETLTMAHPTTGEPLMGISDAPAVFKGPQRQAEYIDWAKGKLDELKEWQKKYPQENVDMDKLRYENAIKDAEEGYFGGSVSDFLEHPEFFKAYPQAHIANVDVTPTLDALGEYRGYSTDIPEIGLRSDVALNKYLNPKEKGLSVLMHELTHYGSHQEGRPAGGNPEMMTEHKLRELLNREYAPVASGKAAYENWWEQSAYNHALQRAKQYEDYAQRQSIKPSALHRLQDWYKYSDDIRQKLGPEPKRAGSQRDAWMRDAFGILARQAHIEGIDKYGSLFDEQLQNKSLRDLLNQERRLDRQRLKHLPDFQEARAIESKYKRLGSMSQEERYKRIADEALARQTQNMLPMTEMEMRQNYPMANEQIGDVDVRDLVNIWRAGTVRK